MFPYGICGIYGICAVCKNLSPSTQICKKWILFLCPIGLVAFAFMRKRVRVLVARLCPTLCDSMDCSLLGSSVHGILQARILELGSHSLLQGLNLGVLCCRQILYHLSHQGSPVSVLIPHYLN